MKAHETTNQSPYLSLAPFKDKEAEYTVSMIPTNSSGDIYHILAYVILAKHYKHLLPRIRLTYDAETTKTQVERCLQFVKFLGYSEYFSPAIKLESKSYQPNPRRDTLHKYFASQEEKVYYLDQKALTMLIARYFSEYGSSVISKIIHNGFLQRNQRVIPIEVGEELKRRIDVQLDKVPVPKAGQKLIVLHIRHSNDANNKQDLNPKFVGKFKEYLEAQGYAVLVILLSSANPSRYLQDSGLKLKDVMWPFETSAHYKGKDYGKIMHIDILTHLLTLPYLKGIVGNTSGTLDLAAFIGHDVYNIHHFKNKQVSDQEYRLLIQTSIFSAEHYEIGGLKPFVAGKDKSLTTDNLAKILKNFTLWINSPTQIHLAPSIDFKQPEKGKGKSKNPVPPDYKKACFRELFFLSAWRKKSQIKPEVEELPCTKATINTIDDRYITCREDVIDALAACPAIKGKNVKQTERIRHTIADYVGVAMKR